MCAVRPVPGLQACLDLAKRRTRGYRHRLGARCEHRGLDLCTSSPVSLFLTCRCCGTSERVHRGASPDTPDTLARHRGQSGLPVAPQDLLSHL
jgi:hypothetical protein